LSTDARVSLFGLEATLAGWGKIENDEVPLILRTANVTILFDTDCVEIYRRLIHENISFPLGELCSIANPYVLIENVIILS
jgi:hypothetical protein